MSQGLECKKIVGAVIGITGILGFIAASVVTIKEPSSMGLNQDDPAYHWRALALIVECGLVAAGIVLGGFLIATYPTNPVPREGAPEGIIVTAPDDDPLLDETRLLHQQIQLPAATLVLCPEIMRSSQQFPDQASSPLLALSNN